MTDGWTEFHAKKASCTICIDVSYCHNIRNSTSDLYYDI